jgi:hypothetical protein
MEYPPLYVARGIMLLVLLTAGCNPVTPEPKPTVVATQPDKTEPAAQPTLESPAPPTPSVPSAPRVSATPTAASAKTPRPVEPGIASPVVVPTPSPKPTLDLNTLKEQLRETKVIGVLTKITLKNQVDDLLDQFREYYLGASKFTMAGLRQSYELLMMKVLSLLQDEDQKLASAISASREAIWAMLSDSKKFAALQG